MIADGSPVELFELEGAALWKKPRGPKNVSLERCDLGQGAGLLKGAYARLPRYFKDADRVMDLEPAAPVHRDQRPPAGSLIGSWKNGERIAQNGRVLQWTDLAGAAGGGSCCNCHQISPQETSHGTLGPTLLKFGWMRGNGPEMQRYVYGKIYNAKAYNLCSQMPRLGHDAESPVNKQ